MKILNLVTLILAIVGGLDLGVMAFADTDVVTAIFGADTAGARIVYGLIGLSALWQLVPFFRALGTSEVAAEANQRPMAH